MRTYVVESFWPGVTEEEFARGAERMRTVAHELRAAGTHIDFLGGVLIPRDEVAFWRFVCGSRLAAEEIVSRADLPCERVLESVELDGASGSAR